LLIWVMIIPMLVKVDFGALHEVRQHAKGIGVTLVVNWLVKPFSMAFLGWLFIRHLFAPMLPADQLDSYIAGLILLRRGAGDRRRCADRGAGHAAGGPHRQPVEGLVRVPDLTCPTARPARAPG
jgi:hypothetical protein